jgi:hypothetical protein
VLRELPRVRQIKGESRRRWFTDKQFDLIVWSDDRNRIVGFQLCYDMPRREAAVTWRKDVGYTHHRVDDGDTPEGKYKRTPILVQDGSLPAARIAREFLQHAVGMDAKVARFVHQKLKKYPS